MADRDGVLRENEEPLRRRDGRLIWVRSNTRVVRDAAGQVLHYEGSIEDITARKQAEEALAESEERFRSAFDRASVGMALQDLDGRYLRVNRALREMFGYTEDELLATSYLTVTHPDDVGSDLEYDRRILAGEIGDYQREKRYLNKAGQVVWALASVSLVRTRDDCPRYYITQVQDITSRKRAEAELARHREGLLQREKIAAMGQLLAGVAHELNNPLSIVVGQTALLQRQAGGGPVGQRAAKIADAAERCARIVRNFLAMARQHPPERQPVALNQIVREALELLAYPLRVDNVEVALDLAGDLPELWADPHQLHQVLVNLVTNAHQALRQGGGVRRLTIRTHGDPARRRVSLEVADTGPGIPPEIQARIFEPFFTTKPVGQGTGLGLSLCQGIVEGHGGTIRAESEPGRGASFVVELPLEVPGARAAEARVPEAPPVAAKAILVVDDELEVADVLAEMLAMDGHRVTTAANGARALERLRRESYDLIVSDVKMPELDGPGLYRELRRSRSDLLRRFVFITGDALSADTAEFLTSTGTPSVSKPFVLEDVRRVIRVVLRQGSLPGAPEPGPGSPPGSP